MYYLLFSTDPGVRTANRIFPEHPDPLRNSRGFENTVTQQHSMGYCFQNAQSGTQAPSGESNSVDLTLISPIHQPIAVFLTSADEMYGPITTLRHNNRIVKHIPWTAFKLSDQDWYRVVDARDILRVRVVFPLFLVRPIDCRIGFQPHPRVLFS
jgi:hypothetical protein